jgi:hypothetical protein
MPHRLLLTEFAICLCAAPLCAQAPFPVRAGSEVRIETTTGLLYRGVFQDAALDSIRLLLEGRGGVISVPSAELRTYSVRQADRRHGAWRGFLIGGAVGLGLVLGLTAANANSGDAAKEIGFLAALPVGLLGGGIGAGIGAALAPTSWSEPARLHARRSAGVKLGVRIGF